MRKIIILVAVVVAILLVVCSIAYRFAAYEMRVAIEHKSGHAGTATVVSVTKVHRAVSSVMPPPRGDYMVCFTITGWGPVRDDPGYEKAERAREQSSGPWCESFDDSPVLSKLKPGANIEIEYLLENSYKMDISRITAFGVDMAAR